MSDLPHIRPARSGDLDACAEILGKWVQATEWMPKLHTPEEDRAFLSRLDENGEILVAGNPVEGFICLRDDEIAALYVGETHRRRDVGSALLQAAQERLPHLSVWCFRANAGARRFYARHGFREGNRTEGENEEGLPDVRLDWRKSA